MNNSFHKSATGILGIIAVFLTFLLPIKFGMIVGTPEVVFAIPDTPITLFFFNWPPALFSLLSGMLLLGIVVFTPPPSGKIINPNFLIASACVCLFLSTLPGILNASVTDFVIIQLLHFAGLACFALAVYRLIELRPEIKIWLLNAIIASTLLTAFMGLSQYISGFQATLDYVYKQEIDTGLKVSSNMQSRLEETRIFATFSICNSLAAHLVLTIPICIWGIMSKTSTLKTVIAVFASYTFLMLVYADLPPVIFFIAIFLLMSTSAISLTKMSKHNKKYIMYVMLLASSGLLLVILRFTNSRGGLIAFASSLLFMLFLTPLQRKIKLAVAILIPLLIGPLIFSDIFSRSLSSMDVRFDYFLAALKMFVKHFFAGTGWGDFFHDYTQIKFFEGAEAPHTPHNFILAFASQAGILGLLASLGVIILPFILFFKSHPIKNFNWQNVVIITGWFAWALHSCVDFNIQVTGTVATGIVMLLLMDFRVKTAPPDPKNASTSKKLLISWYMVAIILSVPVSIIAYNQLKAQKVFSTLSAMCRQSFSQPDSTPPTFFKIEQQLKKTDKLMPYSPFPWITAGNYAQMRKDWPRSEIYYLEAIKRSPERASLYHRLYISQGDLWKKDEAIKNLKKAAELFPNAYGKQLKKYE
jgi:O-antigen ligase/polysaccharide polymerase Wzy-like membrane protein